MCSVQFTQLCPTLCYPMNHSTPGLPVHHQLPVFTQTHVHWLSDAIQPSQPLSPTSPPTFNLSQLFFNLSWLFQWVSSSHQWPDCKSIGISALASVLSMNIQDWFPLGWTGWISLLSKSSPTPQFKSIRSLVLRFLWSPTLTSIHDYQKSHNFD